jgi:hypothetical protein
MRILIVSTVLPYLPCLQGPRARLGHVLDTLARRHTIVVVAITTRGETPAQQAWAEARGMAVRLVPAVAGAGASRGGLPRGLADAPVRREGAPETRADAPARRADAPGGLALLRETMESAIERTRPDVVQLEGETTAGLAGVGGVPTLLAVHGSGTLRRSPADHRMRLGRWLAARLTERGRATERRGMAAADVRVVASAEERAAVHALGVTGRTQVIADGVDLARHELRRAGQPGRIALSADLTAPSDVEVARRFATVVLPRVRARVPGAELLLLGADRVRTAHLFAGVRGVRAGGAVADPRPGLWSAAVAVSPFRTGFGAPSRIVDAMALGTPVVASPSSLDALDGVVPGEHVWAAADDEAMTEATVQVLRDAALADTLARNARALVESRYSWPAVAYRWEALLAEVAAIPATEATA